MALLDFFASSCFRNDAAGGRIVVFPGDRRGRGYLVKVEAEELKIRSFLKMFYGCHFSILLFGYLLASSGSLGLRHSLSGWPSVSPLKAGAVSGGAYLLVVGVPYWLFWRSYKKAFLNFVSPQDEVSVYGGSPERRRLIAAGLLVAGISILAGAIFLATLRK